YSQPLPVLPLIEEKEERQRANEVWCDPEEHGALFEGLVHKMKVAEFEVADATMNQTTRTAAGSPADRPPFDQGDRKSPQRRVPCNSGTNDSAAKDEDVSRHSGATVLAVF